MSSLRLAIVCLAVSIPVPALAQATLLNGLGGTADFGEGVLAANDDGSTTAIDVSAAFPAGLRFYGNVYTTVYVNNNGNVSFGAPLGSYTPSAFPLASTQPPMIAPWWGDVDTRNRMGVGNDDLVYYDISPGRFVATWDATGYYNQHNDHRLSVQLILTDASAFGIAGAFDVEFRYNRCEWTTGDASGGTGGFGGTPAGAGFDSGDGTNYRELPGSRTASVVNLCTTTNVGSTGRWVFQVRPNGVTVCGNHVQELGEGCDDGNTVNGDGCNSRCSVELAPGAACGDDIQCHSGFCTDGVCCNARCDGQCEACGEAATLGTCSAVSGTPRGMRTACDAAGTTCGGVCGGTNRTACAFPDDTTTCDDGSACSANDVCNGLGLCAGTGLTCDDGLDCTSNSCSVGSGCANTLQAGFCVIGSACIAAGTPAPGSQCMVCDPTQSTSAYSPIAVGTSCTDNSMCTVGDACDATGSCVSGAPVTCADDGLSCTAEVCEPTTGSCIEMVTEGCAIGGACIGEGTLDPSNACMQCNSGKNPMGYSPVDMGTLCSNPSCAASTLTLAGACDMSGTCVPGAANACAHGCADATSCMDACTMDSQCPLAQHCDTTSGNCVDDATPGTTCTQDAACASGFCVDGVCCDTRCNDVCEACDSTGSAGTCTPFANGTDPDDECAGALTCNGTGMCMMAPVDSGVVDGGMRDGGAVLADAGARDAGAIDAGAGDANVRGDASTGGAAGGGCGCSTPGSTRASWSWLVALGLVVTLRARRRR